MLLEPDEDPSNITESDIKDANNPSQIIDSDEESDEDIGIDWNYYKFIFVPVNNKMCFVHLVFVLLDYIRIQVYFNKYKRLSWITAAYLIIRM